VDVTHVKRSDAESPGTADVGEPPLAEREDLNGVRTPRQQRSKASLDRVLAAGAEVLIDGGYAAFTINEVARRAGASTGLIYARFKDKAALFEAVMLRETTRIVGYENAALEALAGRRLPTRDLIEGIVRLLADIARREAPLTQAFMERTTVEPALIGHTKRLRTGPRRITALLVERGAELRQDDAERAADMAFWIATSALERRVHTDMWRHWQSEPDSAWDTFVSDLVQAVQSFLLPDPPMARHQEDGETAARELERT
jgi:AcrR family transcriptional regulator